MNNIIDSLIAVSGACIALVAVLWAANWWLTLLLT